MIQIISMYYFKNIISSSCQLNQNLQLTNLKSTYSFAIFHYIYMIRNNNKTYKHSWAWILTGNHLYWESPLGCHLPDQFLVYPPLLLSWHLFYNNEFKHEQSLFLLFKICVYEKSCLSSSTEQDSFWLYTYYLFLYGFTYIFNMNCAVDGTYVAWITSLIARIVILKSSGWLVNVF